MKSRNPIPIWLRAVVYSGLIAAAIPLVTLTAVVAEPPKSIAPEAFPEKAKTRAAAGDGIATLDLERIDKSTKATAALKMAPGQIKAFESGPGVFWTLVPSSAGADEKAITSVKLTAGSIAFGVDATTKEFGQFKVPDGKTAYVLGCSPSLKVASQFTLIKSLFDKDKGEPEELGRMVITVGPDGDVVPDGGDQGNNVKPTPVPNKVDKVYIAIVTNATNVSVDHATLLADTAFWNALPGTGGDWDRYDVTSDEAVKKGYVKALGDKIPGILILNKDSGKILKNEKLPTTKDEIQKLVAGVKK